MKNILIAMIIVLSVEFFQDEVLAYGMRISLGELIKDSEVIVLGTVEKNEATNEKKDYFPGASAQVKYAELKVEELFKGAGTEKVIVKYAYSSSIEADVQDPDLSAGKRVLLYLKPNNDKRGSYSVIYGWSGACYFFSGRFYHQYFDRDFFQYREFLRTLLHLSPISVREKEAAQALAVANNKALELGYDVDALVVDIGGVIQGPLVTDEYDYTQSEWDALNIGKSQWENDITLKEKLADKLFWVVFYRGPYDIRYVSSEKDNLWVFVDKNSGEIISTFK
ncbi:MAG: hypothetical protein KKC84_02260 [Candidatus Omnitrophica bacterium]|nr:hypothetical protein [Candidatus Omnitrophota bacterium]